MKYDPEKHHRRSIRLKGYDYSQPGAYFITIVTQERTCLFGDVVDGQMRLNDTGEIVRQCWLDIPAHFPNTGLDEFVVMPNHVHGIIVIVGAGSPRPYNAPDAQTAPDAQSALDAQTTSGAWTGMGAETASIRRATLGQIVAYFKYQSTKRINERRGTTGASVWQRNYYEHIIHDDAALQRIREYIANNPLQWELDRENQNREARNVVPSSKDESWRI